MGGIEKFNRAFMKALYEELDLLKGNIEVLSCYDEIANPAYIPLSSFKGFKGNKILFTLRSLTRAGKSDIIILGHINLALIGLIIKFLFPSKKVLLIAHGIEVWTIRSFIKKAILARVDKILVVSQFTANKIIAGGGFISIDKINIFYNTLDPFFNPPFDFTKPKYLQKRYGLSSASKIILTITRISNAEQYKGYDTVIQIMSNILRELPNSFYLLCGKYDTLEKDRIERLIKINRLENKVIMPGFIDDTELIDHYLLADVFVMPSKKEGFGIVFVEAMACGANVIAGNQDGSAEALLDGKLGKLIDPNNNIELEQAIVSSLLTNTTNKYMLQQEVLQNFGFAAYKKRLQNVLNNNFREEI